MLSNLLSTLGPEIKLFILSSVVLGLIAIVGLLTVLKTIEKKNPNKIRWR